MRGSFNTSGIEVQCENKRRAPFFFLSEVEKYSGVTFFSNNVRTADNYGPLLTTQAHEITRKK